MFDNCKIVGDLELNFFNFIFHNENCRRYSYLIGFIIIIIIFYPKFFFSELGEEYFPNKSGGRFVHLIWPNINFWLIKIQVICCV